MPPAVDLQSPNRLTAREVPQCANFIYGLAVFHLYIQSLEAKGKDLSLETLISSSIVCLRWGSTL